MSNSVQPHRRQPTRLPHPWDSPGKSTGVGCHFLLQCIKVKSEREVAQSCPTLSDPMDCSLPGFSVHGIFQAKYWSGVPLPSPKTILNSGKYYFTFQHRNTYWHFWFGSQSPRNLYFRLALPSSLIQMLLCKEASEFFVS